MGLCFDVATVDQALDLYVLDRVKGGALVIGVIDGLDELMGVISRLYMALQGQSGVQVNVLATPAAKGFVIAANGIEIAACTNKGAGNFLQLFAVFPTGAIEITVLQVFLQPGQPAFFYLYVGIDKT